MTDTIATTPGVKTLPSLNDAARQNVQTGVLLLVKEACVTAMLDRELTRGQLAVLGAIARFLNNDTAKAWPSRQAIAALTGMGPKAVNNRLLELREKGYLISDRQTVQEAGGKSLMVYTFGDKAVDHETIRREINKYIDGMRNRNAPADADEDEKSPPAGTLKGAKSPRAGTVVPTGGDFDPKVPTGGDPKSPPAGYSNSSREEEKKVSTAAAPQSLKDLCWKQAYGWILSQYPEIDPARTRARFGGLYTEYGAGALLDAVFKAQQMTAVNPLDYITKILSSTKSGKASSAAARQIEAMK